MEIEVKRCWDCPFAERNVDRNGYLYVYCRILKRSLTTLDELPGACPLHEGVHVYAGGDKMDDDIIFKAQELLQEWDFIRVYGVGVGKYIRWARKAATLLREIVKRGGKNDTNKQEKENA